MRLQRRRWPTPCRRAPRLASRTRPRPLPNDPADGSCVPRRGSSHPARGGVKRLALLRLGGALVPLRYRLRPALVASLLLSLPASPWWLRRATAPATTSNARRNEPCPPTRTCRTRGQGGAPRTGRRSVALRRSRLVVILLPYPRPRAAPRSSSRGATWFVSGRRTHPWGPPRRCTQGRRPSRRTRSRTWGRRPPQRSRRRTRGRGDAGTRGRGDAGTPSASTDTVVDAGTPPSSTYVLADVRGRCGDTVHLNGRVFAPGRMYRSTCS